MDRRKGLMPQSTTRRGSVRKDEAVRYVREILLVYLNVLRDVLYAYPALEADISKDWSRLAKNAVERGLPFFMVDLPSAGKHLDRCLASGTYTTSGLPCTNGAGRRIPIPNLFRGLYLRVFDIHGHLKEDADVVAILFLRQLLYLAKRATYPCSDEHIDLEVEEFLVTDASLPVPDQWWSNQELDRQRTSEIFKGFAQSPVYKAKVQEVPSDVLTGGTEIARTKLSLLAMLDQVSNVVALTLGLYDPLEWRFSHGPGAVSNAKTDENRYRFKAWSERLESVFSFADCGFHNYRSWIAASFNRVWSINRYGSDAVEVCATTSEVTPSLLLNVPKTLTKPRLIAEEPYEHMWCQQNIWDYVRTRVQDTWIGQFINFGDQTMNREMARRGSEDGSLATIDLKSASDRVSCECVGNMFRANHSLLHALRACRTHVIEVNDSTVELRKFSTMGSSCTFPVQSLVFLSVALAGTLIAKGSRGPFALDRTTSPEEEILKLAGEVAVFGDDIIVPTEAVPLVRVLLEVLDFKINSAKTFTEGNFRESCGADCFRGELVSPAYWKGPFVQTPESYASTVEVSNNFYQRLLVHTAEYLRTELDRRWKTPVIAWDSGCLGVKSLVSPSLNPDFELRKRWNKSTQDWECYVLVVETRTDVTDIQDDSCLLQFFTEQPDPLTQWEGGVRARAVSKIAHRWVPLRVISPTSLDGTELPLRPASRLVPTPCEWSLNVLGHAWSPVVGTATGSQIVRSADAPLAWEGQDDGFIA